MNRKLILLLSILLLCVGVALSNIGTVNINAQVVQSSTPARITLPQATDLPLINSDPLLATATPTRTATPQSGAFLEATDGEVNVRADASTEAERLGAIRPGDQYRIRGRYFQWLQFEFPTAPNGLGWVFDELVTITGDTTQIADLSLTPTVGSAGLGVPTLTLVATGDGSGVNLSSIESLENSGNVIPGEGGVVSTSVALPTYTYPPDIIAQAPTQGPSATPTQSTSVLPEISVSDGVAPVVPIAALGLLGSLGLIFSLMRRR